MEFDAKYKFLKQVIFAGLPDLNTGFDSGLINHVSPRDFSTVIARCAKLHVHIIGIEVFDIRTLPVQMLEVRHARKARTLVKAYRNRPGISFCASFDVGDNVPKCKSLLDGKELVDLEAALGGRSVEPARSSEVSDHAVSSGRAQLGSAGKGITGQDSIDKQAVDAELSAKVAAMTSSERAERLVEIAKGPQMDGRTMLEFAKLLAGADATVADEDGETDEPPAA